MMLAVRELREAAFSKFVSSIASLGLSMLLSLLLPSTRLNRGQTGSARNRSAMARQCSSRDMLTSTAWPRGWRLQQLGPVNRARSEAIKDAGRRSTIHVWREERAARTDECPALGSRLAVFGPQPSRRQTGRGHKGSQPPYQRTFRMTRARGYCTQMLQVQHRERSFWSTRVVLTYTS